MIVAAHDANDGRTPSGKNGPRGDYTFTSGIWQTVWLEPVGAAYVHNIRLLPDLENNRLQVTVATYPGTTITATALKNNMVVASGTSSPGKTFYIPIKDPVYWTPDTPFLYDLQLTLRDASGKITDEVKSYFGKKSGDTVINNASDLSMYLLNVAHVSTVAGDAFGAPDYIRISFANSMENIEEGFKRIKSGLWNLS